MTPRTEMAVALGVVAVGGLVALVAAGQPRTSQGAVGPEVSADGTPAAGALGLVVLAGAAAALLVRSRVRRVLGIVLLAAALGVVAAYALSEARAPSTGLLVPGEDAATDRSAWVWVGLVGGLVAAAGAAAVAVRAGRWPEPRRRYAGAQDAQRPPADAWEALDRGEDPTA